MMYAYLIFNKQKQKKQLKPEWAKTNICTNDQIKPLNEIIN